MANLDEANNLLNPGDGIEIVNHRYKFPHPDTGNTVTVSRVTTVIEALDDKTTLMAWREANAAIGVARTPSLQAKLLGCDPKDRKQTKAIIEEALTAAGANERRELGSGLHAITERVDAGHLDPADVPEPWGAHVANYQRALRNGCLRPHPGYIERVVYNAAYNVAGKIDRLYLDHEDRLVVGDLKTGGYTSWLKWSAQLAFYATATHMWNPTARQWDPMPDVRQDHALLVHLPTDADWCVIEPLDIPTGVDAALMALEIRRTRARKLNHLKATTWQPPTYAAEPAPVELDDPAAVWRAWIADRVETIRAFPEALRTLADLWPTGVPTLKQSTAHTLDQLPLIEHAVNAVERRHGLPFPAQRPAGLPELRTPTPAAA